MPATVIDPVCGMKVEKEEAEKSQFQGKTEYFCSEECKTAFDKEPARYEKKPVSAKRP